ncbi:hypothetical protein ACFPDQ_06690 [Pseudofrancisella aestuarii]|uniref:Lipoprotein n=1 Tax=Pseudofrancisella aestuarii TaxID=2670347 RepID=A0ABV9TEN9_9GAMM|nr:hypothetical protein [Pseudofrancisella aestuarii]
MKGKFLTLIVAIFMLSACTNSTEQKPEPADVGKDSKQYAYHTKNIDIPYVYGITNMAYALCSKSSCTLAKDGGSAKCQCEVFDNKSGWKSFSFSPTNYVSASPTYNSDGSLQTVQSNYSMANINDFTKTPNNACKYDSPEPWANCYGVRCQVEKIKVNGEEKTIATCQCPVIRNKNFLVGTDDKNACDLKGDKIWSGITVKTLKSYGGDPTKSLYQEVYPDSPPSKASLTK